MKIECAHDELVDLSRLQPNPLNPNKHPERQIKLLADIIAYQGQRAPIVVSRRSGFITKGHGRLEAIKLLGWAKAAVDHQEYENEAQEYADMVADNKIAELAEHDDAFMLESLRKLDLSPLPTLDLLGIPDFKLPEVIEPQCDEDEVPEPKDSIAKLGDVWKLGEHRLMCGDSTDIGAVEKLMNGEKADMVFTDPPYGMNLDTDYDDMYAFGDHTHTGNRFKKVEGDDKAYDPNPIFAIKAKRYFIWGADYFYNKLPDGGCFIAWDKRNENLDRVPGNTTEFCWASPATRRTSVRIIWSGHYGMTGDDSGKRMRPTQKPIKLAEWFFEHWGKDAKTVVDIYGGSGSTLIACEKTNRKCFMMELDPHYVDVTIARWEKYTGKKAALIE